MTQLPENLNSPNQDNEKLRKGVIGRFSFDPSSDDYYLFPDGTLKIDSQRAKKPDSTKASVILALPLDDVD